MTRIEVSGQTFGFLTILNDAGHDSFGHRKVLVKCRCGVEKIFSLGSIKSGSSKSCGCEKNRILSALKTTHGLRKHPLYRVMYNMKSRCYNHNSQDFKDYGGRGIKICSEWLNDFRSFYDFAIKNGWRKGLQIDRINNDGDYTPFNCRIATPQENVNNKRLLSSLNTSGYRGVTRRGSMFTSRVRISGYPFVTKTFKTAKEAAEYRDKYCISFGIKTTLNFPHNKEMLP